MDALGAARTGDQIGHGVGLLGMLAGAAAGAVIGLAVVAGTVATGGLLAGVIIAGSVAGGALATQQILKGMTKIFKLPDPPTGILHHGSHEVMINSLPAARATGDGSYACTGGSGFYWNHPALPVGGILPSGILLAEGSKTVLFNNLPAARVGSLLTCAAKVLSGSRNVFIGGPTLRTEFVWDTTGWLETGFTFLGLAALGGAALIAVKAGLVATGVFALVTGGAFAGLEGVGQFGDMLGPGYRDLFQGILGMGLLLAGPKLAKTLAPKEGVIESSPLDNIKKFGPAGKEKYTPQETTSLDLQRQGKKPFLEDESILDSNINFEEIPTKHWNKKPAEPIQNQDQDISIDISIAEPTQKNLPVEILFSESQPETVFFGNAGFHPKLGFVTIPEGTELVFYIPHAAKMSLSLGRLIAQGIIPKFIKKYSFGSGKKIPNYLLDEANEFFVFGARLFRVFKPTELSEVLKPHMGRCHWAACRFEKGKLFSNTIYTPEKVIHNEGGSNTKPPMILKKKTQSK